MCFSLDWIEHICIMIALIVIAFLVLQLFIPWLLSQVGLAIPAIIIQLFRILVWGAFIIVGIIICFDLFKCVIGSAHM